MSTYKEEFPVGSFVRIKSTPDLEKFMRPTWAYHHPLWENQLTYAGSIARVSGVSFYHGGDALYQLDAVPGIWHEECVESCETLRRAE